MALTVQPLSNLPELDAIREELTKNVSQRERAVSIALGAGLIGYGLTRRSLGGALLGLLGAGFLARGATGHCRVYGALGVNSGALNTESGVPGDKGIKVSDTIEIHRPPSEVYAFWRKLENLPRFFDHLETVEELDHERSRWVVRGPVGTQLEWTARLINEHENEMLSWESLPGADVQNAGSVWFEPVGEGGLTTRVKVTMQYHPPTGAVGAAISRLFGEAPEQQLASDLQRLKEVLESAVS